MDLPNTFSISIKTEPRTREGDGGETPDMEISLDFQDVQKARLEYNKNIFDKYL